MRIIGGLGTMRSVALFTTDFRSVASLNRDGSITRTIKKRSWFEKFLSKNRFLFPKILVLSLLILMSLTKKQLLIFGTIMLIVPLVVSQVVTQISTDPNATAESLNEWMRLTRPLLLVPVLWMIHKYAGGFHAAEHMAISAYGKYGADGINHIAEQPRVNEYCGGRLVVPAVLAGWTVALCSHWLGHATIFVSLFALELILWIDKFIGLNKIYVTAKISEWLQTYITTRTPTEKELLVGKKALQQLLVAHEERFAIAP